MRGNESDGEGGREGGGGNVGEDKDGGRLRREQGVVWLFEHFRHKFAREGARGSFAPRNAPILLPFVFSFCPRLSSCLLALAVCTYIAVACRAFRPIRGSLARRLEWRVEVSAGVRKRDGAIW